MSLPKNVTRYIKGLMCVFENATCSILSEINVCSHDSLTRVLNGKKLCWQTLLPQFIRRTFGKLQDGWLIIDDTIIPKKFARKIESVGWLFDTKLGKNILGINLVLLVWSNGKVTLPLAIRVYQKGSGKSKVDLAIELLIWAKKQKIKPKFVAFDSWYPSKELLQTIVKLRWKFVTQFKSNRKLNGIPLKEIQRNPYWMMIGKISCGIRVIVVRNGKKYYATNDLSMSKKELLDAYRGRWKVEMVFRMLHFKLGLDDCQTRKFDSQLAHFHLCLFAYIALERESHDTNQSIYQIKRNCSFHFEQANNILTKLVFQGA